MLKQSSDLMHAWSNSRKAGTECAMAVESLLKRIVDERMSGNMEAIAATEDYNCLLEGWARSGAGVAGAERCEQILTEMEERFKQGDSLIQPNLQSFKAVLMAWKQSGASFAAVRAQRVLEWMVRLAAEGENEQVLPDGDSFDIVLQIWSRSGLPDAPEKTEQLLTAMERLYLATNLDRVRPRTSSFNAVLAAWSKSGAKGSTKRATDILEFMERRADEGWPGPDEASYTTVVTALLKSKSSNSAQQSEAFLQNAEDILGPDNAPDTIFYNMVIGAQARSNNSGAYRRARSILDRQVKKYEEGCRKCKPDVYGFTSVIAAASMEPANIKERNKAFHAALAAFQQLSKYDNPTHVTYGTMLKACARLLPNNDRLRHRWGKRIFRQAVEDGCVGDMVVSRMREAVSPPIYRDLMKGNKKQNLPEQWTRNVEEKNEYRNKKFLQGNTSNQKKNGRRAEV